MLMDPLQALLTTSGSALGLKIAPILMGYAKLEVDLTLPSIGVAQDADSLDAGTQVMLNTNATFGQSVSLDGEYLAVGVHQHDGWSGSKTGAVYIFKRHGGIWRLQQEISDASSGFHGF